jgi:hypothetical protein
MNTHHVPLRKTTVGIEREKGREEGVRRERVKRGIGIKETCGEVEGNHWRDFSQDQIVRSLKVTNTQCEENETDQITQVVLL